MRATLTADGARVETDLLSRLAGHDHPVGQREENVRRFTESLRQCGDCHHTPDLEAEFDAVRESFDAYQTVAGPLFAGDNTRTLHDLELQAIKHADRFVERTTKLADRAAEHIEIDSMAARASIRNAWIVLSITLVALLIGGGIVAFHLKRSLTRPVEALVEGIKRVGEGDLAFRFPAYTDEEFRLLAEAFNKAHDDLNDIQEKILQTERLAAVGKLTAGVAHEVLNPLASISSIAQLMRRRNVSDEVAGEIDLIMEAITRVSMVVRELLTFSRSEAKEEKSNVDLGPVLDHAVALVNYDPRARRIKIQPCYDSDLPPLYANGDRLLLVFTNIMLNALDAMNGSQAASGALKINAGKQDAKVVLEFEDNGPGMAREQIAHAFEPFYTTKDPGKGTGLGLWISYQVIQQHDGRIHIDSRVGNGTKIIIELPCN
jgi:signal transduction histidine kinase